VANYFRAHGWETGQPVAVPATVSGNDIGSIIQLGYQPHSLLGTLGKEGITPDRKLPADLKAALLQYDQETGPEYWLGFNNFYVITRYNHSPLYAMAVYQLSEEIRAGYVDQQQALHEQMP
jgi:membrane-bound lytic murein transglycosylase B